MSIGCKISQAGYRWAAVTLFIENPYKKLAQWSKNRLHLTRSCGTVKGL